MKDFIELHNSDCGSNTTININAIKYFESLGTKTKIYVSLTNDLKYIEVIESYRKVRLLIQEAQKC